VNWVPLAVGESYDFVMSIEDEVGNEFTRIEAFEDDSTIGPRHISLKIVDTIAPHLEFTAVKRALPIWEGITLGDDDEMVNPTRVHAQAFEYIEARLPGRDLDMAYAEFVYRKMGDTSWNLIDATLEEVDLFTWRVGPWDLRTLEHGEWYEVAVIGVDDVGNADTNPDVIHVYVDYEAPEFEMTSPAPVTSTWCNGIMDLVVQVDRGATQVIDGYTWRQHDDVFDVIWQWKPSAEVGPESWTDDGVSGALLYDDGTNKYSRTLDLDWEISTDIPGMPSGLYDLRVVVIDEAGNAALYEVIKNTVDNTQPDYVQISNIVTIGDDTTQDPGDQGQYTDVTAGTMVEIWGTASDDEAGLPNMPDPETGRFYETVITAMQFQVRAGDAGAWHDLGVVQLDPPDHGDMSAQSASVLWNTTGLDEGTYWLRVMAWDECGNFAFSDPVDVRVIDWTPPIARIMGWDADLQPHGHDAPSWITIYALAECDADMDYDVQFQYALRQGDETTPTGPWVNIGIGEQADVDGDDYTTGELWYTTIQPIDLSPTLGDIIWLRALVRDENGHRYGDLPDDQVPTVLVELVPHMHDRPCAEEEEHPSYEDGMITFKQVRSEDMLNGREMVESVSVMVESRDNLILTVKMTTPDHAPRAFLYWEPSQPEEYPTSQDNVRDYSPGVRVGNQRGLVRSLDDPTVWRCLIDIAYLNDCDHYAFWVTGLVDGGDGNPLWIDMDNAYFREYPVTAGLGTNGAVWVHAYDGLCASAMVPSGAVGDSDCLLISPTIPPLVSVDQLRYLEPVPHTAYHIAMEEGPFAAGYHAEVKIGYSAEMAERALQGADARGENLTVRRWDGEQWIGAGLSHIRDTGNEVVFRVDTFADVDDLGKSSYGLGQIFQLFVPRGDAPIVVSNIWPHSPYVNDWWTDADPVMVVYLRDEGGQEIDAERVELLIDGEYWATWYGGAGDADWIRGNGSATLLPANFDATVYELVYYHSTYPRDWLTDGEHELTVRYKPLDGYGTDEWISNDVVFFVDRTSPYIEFDGGFVSNPGLRNVHGYMNPTTGQLVARMYDGGIGVLFKHDRPWYLPDLNCDGVLDPLDRQFDPCPYPDWTWYPWYDGDDDHLPDQCWIRVDWGMKYDLWLIQPHENDQNDIDEIEERILIHTGTANQLEPWLMRTNAEVTNERITLDQYNPANDTLVVPIPVMGGGLIKNGDMLEITWYAEKTIEANSDGPGWGCAVDTIVVGGQSYLIYAHGCTYDSESQEMHIYDEGIMDWAGNTGSKYVEQRFMVDMSGPVVHLLSPAGRVEPSGNMKIEILTTDPGSGVADVHVTVMDPEGKDVIFDPPLAYSNGKITGELEGPLMNGDYKINVIGRDMLGNVSEVVETVRVEAAVLTMSEPKIYPNPFNPGNGDDAVIRFDITKTSEVTVKVYDWAGQFVRTITNNERWEPGQSHVKWDGQANDGTDLANGAYMARITARDLDTGRTRESTLKIVIWRE